MPPDAPGAPDAQKVLKETGDKLKTMPEADKKDLSADAKLKIEKGEVKALFEVAGLGKDKPKNLTEDQKLLQKAIEMAINKVAEEQKLTPDKIKEIISGSETSEQTAPVDLNTAKNQITEKVRLKDFREFLEGNPGQNKAVLDSVLTHFGSKDTSELQSAKLMPFLKEELKKAQTEKPDKFAKLKSYLSDTLVPLLSPHNLTEIPLQEGAKANHLDDGKYGNDTHTAVLLYLKWQELNMPEPEKPEVKVPPLERTPAPKENAERIPEGAAFSVVLTREIMDAKGKDWFTSTDGTRIPEGKTIFYKMDPSGQMMTFIDGMDGNQWRPSELNTRKTYKNLAKGVTDKDRTHAAQGETIKEIAFKFKTSPDSIREYAREKEQNLESTIFRTPNPKELADLGFKVDSKNSSITLDPSKKIMLLNSKDGNASVTTQLGDRDDGSKIVKLNIKGNEITIRRESKPGPDGISLQYDEQYKVVSEEGFMKEKIAQEEKKQLGLAKEGKKVSEGIKSSLGLTVDKIDKQGTLLDISAGQLTMKIHEGQKDTIMSYLAQNKDQINNILKKPENKLNIELLMNGDKPTVTLKVGSNNVNLNPTDFKPSDDMSVKRTITETDGSKRDVEAGRVKFKAGTTVDTISSQLSEADKTISEGPVKIKVPSKIGKEVNAYRIAGEPEKYSLISKDGYRVTFTPGTSGENRFVLEEPKPKDFHFDDTNLTTLTGYEGNTHRWSTRKWTFNILENSPYAFEAKFVREKTNKKKKEEKPKEEKAPDKTTPQEPKPEKAAQPEPKTVEKKDAPKPVEVVKKTEGDPVKKDIPETKK